MTDTNFSISILFTIRICAGLGLGKGGCCVCSLRESELFCNRCKIFQ